MSTRYERFNEMIFESYCKTTINRAILKGRMEKSKRAGREFSITTLTDAALLKLCPSMTPVEDTVRETVTFRVQEFQITVHDLDLGQALSFLTPQKRDVVLLYYFADMSDVEIAHRMGVGKSTIQRRRVDATNRLKNFLGERV